MNIFANRAKPVADLTEPIELRLLRHRLVRIQEVLAELPQQHESGRLTPKEAAEAQARRDLLDLRRTTLTKIADLTAPPDLDKAARDERVLDLDEREKKEHLPGQLERWGGGGDWNQWRLAFVNQVVIREVAAKQFNLIIYSPPGY